VKKLRCIGLNLILLTLMLVMHARVYAETVVEQGGASYYADSLQGSKTASGEPYDKEALTAAHRTLPFGTRVKVTYLKTGKSIDVVINDRGPHSDKLIIDVSGAAARALGLTDDGRGEVRLEVLGP
jgi:rare lipoprotein A